MNNRLIALILPTLMLLFASCKNHVEEDLTYYNWESRNAEWFAEVYDGAKAEIEKAKAQYPNGNEWEEHCDWRLYKTLLKSQDTEGASTDYIVCKINERGDGEWSAAYTDSVLVYYRGWIMDVNYPTSKNNMTVFSQSYYGEFNKDTAAPIAMPVLSTVEGFMTAVQYMVKGDDWDVYIPQQLAYQETSSDAIPAYSTLLYHLRIEKVHKSGSGLSEWR